MMHTAIDLTPLFQSLIILIAAIITTFVVPWIKEKTTKEQQEAMQMWVSIGVNAAEKLYGAGHGSDKLAYVVRLLQDHGFTLDVKTLEAVVNSEIKRMEQLDLMDEMIVPEEPAEEEE